MLIRYRMYCVLLLPYSLDVPVVLLCSAQFVLSCSVLPLCSADVCVLPLCSADVCALPLCSADVCVLLLCSVDVCVLQEFNVILRVGKRSTGV